VKNWLVLKGSLNGRQIQTKGWGTAKPVAPNANPDGSDNPEGRQQNRRVEITVRK
jgi:outer membrane protein OmpA-like peptidoglycan-associated protein